MKVYKCGTAVKTVIGGYEALITAFTCRGNKVQYEVSYFFGGDYKTAWLDATEFVTRAGSKIQPIGFIK